MKKLFVGLLLLITVVGLSACNCGMCGLQTEKNDPSITPPRMVKANHPALTEQEKLLPCFECHQEVTPEIYDEWYRSSHGIGSVKCYQCHGTYEELSKVPDILQCAVCHAGSMNYAESGKLCWDCHLNHTFTGH